ncbi:MAG: hypothetical protein GY754_06185 [bacterium]|nr:hypothetical protein [bacterium]
MRFLHYICIPITILLLSGTLLAQDSLFRPNGSNFFIYNRGNKQFILHQSKLTQWNLNKAMSRLSSAKRINSAADDPAGLAVAEKMEKLLQQLRQESMNDANMRNLHHYVESAIAQDHELLKRIRLLILRSSSGILTAEDRGYNQSEINQLLRQIDMNARFSQFNTKQVIPELTTAKLGLNRVDVVRNLYKSIGIVDEAMKKLQKKRIVQGVKSNILTFRIKGKSYHYLNLQQAESTIRDMDMAEGISNLMKNNVLLKSQHGMLMKSK